MLDFDPKTELWCTMASICDPGRFVCSCNSWLDIVGEFVRLSWQHGLASFQVPSMRIIIEQEILLLLPIVRTQPQPGQFWRICLNVFAVYERTNIIIVCTRSEYIVIISQPGCAEDLVVRFYCSWKLGEYLTNITWDHLEHRAEIGMNDSYSESNLFVVSCQIDCQLYNGLGGCVLVVLKMHTQVNLLVLCDIDPPCHKDSFRGCDLLSLPTTIGTYRISICGAWIECGVAILTLYFRVCQGIFGIKRVVAGWSCRICNSSDSDELSWKSKEWRGFA